MNTDHLVDNLDRKGRNPAQIAAALGITQGRVESILDRLAAEVAPLTPHVPASTMAPLPKPPKLSPAGQRAVRRPAPRTATVSHSGGMKHGTPSGYATHRKRGENPCQDCRIALSDYQREWRRKKTAAKQLTEGAPR